VIIIGLTGSIAMGKSTAAAHLRGKGIPVLDSDAVVHDMYRSDAVPLIESAFPGVTHAGAVDRAALGRQVLGSPAQIAKLEAIVHPLVRQRQWAFLEAEHDRGADLAVLEIPLLFETAPPELFDAVMVVSAPEAVQRERLLAREGMTAEKLDAILARQMPDAGKRARADYVVDTGRPLPDTLAQIDAVLTEAAKRPALAYHRWAGLSREF
jgi:dephospho-CoA kinase